MKIPTIILLGFCLSLVLTFRTLKGKDIPADYAIGNFMFIMSIDSDRIYFSTFDDMLGFIDAKTGLLLTMYELEEGEHIISYRGHSQVVIAKDKDINVFLIKEEKYIKFQYSQYLQKQTFTKIISFKRFIKHDYILTDEFLLKAENPYTLTNPLKGTPIDKYFMISNRTDKEQVYFDIVFLITNGTKDQGIGLVIIKSINGKKNMCINKFLVKNDTKQEMICYELDPQQQFTGVTDLGNAILVMYKNYKVKLNHKLQLVKTYKKNENVPYFQQLNLLKGNKSLTSNQQGKTRIFFNPSKPREHYSLQIFQKHMLVKRENKVIASIEKGETDDPISILGNSSDPMVNSMNLIIYFGNGVVNCYQIDQQNNSHTKLWGFQTKEAVKKEEGEETEAEQVDLEQEEKIIEQGQQAEKDQQKKQALQNNNQDIQGEQP